MYNELIEKGIKININSDDPAFFKGYISENYLDILSTLGSTEE